MKCYTKLSRRHQNECFVHCRSLWRYEAPPTQRLLPKRLVIVHKAKFAQGNYIKTGSPSGEIVHRFQFPFTKSNSKCDRTLTDRFINCFINTYIGDFIRLFKYLKLLGATAVIMYFSVKQCEFPHSPPYCSPLVLLSFSCSVLSAEGRGKIKSQYHSPFHQPSATADKATHQLSLPPTITCAPSISLSSITLSCTLVNGDVKSGEILFSSSFSSPPPRSPSSHSG